MKDTSGSDKQQVQPWHHAMEQNKLHLVCQSLRELTFLYLLEHGCTFGEVRQVVCNVDPKI